jgi:hypothetical protein
MRTAVLFLLAVAAGLGAGDPWSRVRELKTGVELRIFKRDSRRPVIATMDRATERHLLIATKDRQLAIPKDEIERIDQRPSQSGNRFEKETRTVTKMSDGTESAAGRPGSHAGVSTSSSTGVRFGSKAEFETVYRRPEAAPR